MRLRTTDMQSGATGAGVGTTAQPERKDWVAQVTGITTATVDIQGSLDNTNWETLSSLTADGKYENSAAWKYVRANISAYTSGTINAKLHE